MTEDIVGGVVDETAHAQMVELVGSDRIGTFLGMLRARLVSLGDLSDVVGGGRASLTEVHKVVSEAGILGFTPLSSACRALEDAVKAGTGAEAAAVIALTAAADAIAEIDRRSAA